MMLTNVTVLYHADADGFGSAYALWKSMRSNATYIPVQYSQPVPEIPEGTDVLYIVDFSYDRETCEELAGKYDLHIFDHHKTAEENLRGLPYARFDATKSGCGMVWEALHGPELLPEMLEFVQDRDLWKFELPDSDIVNMYIATLPHDFEVWHREATREDFLLHAYESGAAISAFREGQIKGALRDTRAMCLTIGDETWEVPACNCSANVSEVGNRLCAEYPEAQFSVTYCDRKGVRSWSLRSVGEFDVSRIARLLGGGGHKNAAGFSTEIGWPALVSEEFIKGFEENA
jgi:oligoribonuclease NrnB/cAMP/cGMP phosphodiesterase (DHH superfamily)